MRSLNRGGFTLLELLMVMMLMLVIVGATYQSIIATQRTTGALVQRMGVHQSTRAAAYYMTHVLRELDAGEGDIAAGTATTLEIRGMRWVGVLCSLPAGIAGGGVLLTVRRDAQYGLRLPDAALDSILLFREGQTRYRSDDRWLVGGLRASAARTCDDGSPGLGLAVEVDFTSGGAPAALDGVLIGSPVRGFQQEEFSLFSDGTDRWLGHRSADRPGTWTSVWPLLGPLTTSGLAFEYFTTTGGVPATLDEIASIGLTVRGRSMYPLSGSGYVQDSIITRVALRNNPRF